MVNYSSAVLDATFSALSDSTRRAILARLARGESTVKALAEPFAMSLPAVSKHLRVLESAGLLKREIDGRIHRCRLDADPLKDAAAFIEYYRRFWEAQFDALQKFLESPNEERKQPWQHRKKAKAAPGSPSRSGAPSLRLAKKSSPRGPSATS